MEPLRYSLMQTVAPTAEPLHRAEFKAHSKIDISDEDALVDGYLAASRRTLESEWKFQAVAATWRMRMDRLQWHSDYGIQWIPLPRPPLLNVVSFVYVDPNGVSTTWGSSNYTVDSDSQPGRLVLAYGAGWPSIRSQSGAITITYRAGYVAPFTATTGDVLTIPATTYANAEMVRLSNSGGTLPGGLAKDLDYYVVNSTGSTVQLSTASGGSAVDVTDTGSGLNFVGELPYPLRVGIAAYAAHLYENREPINIGNIVNTIPMHVTNLMASVWDGVVY